MPFRFGPWEIALVLVIILIVFGMGKLPQAGAAIGKGLQAFRRGQAGDDEEEMPKPGRKLATKIAKASSRQE